MFWADISLLKGVENCPFLSLLLVSFFPAVQLTSTPDRWTPQKPSDCLLLAAVHSDSSRSVETHTCSHREGVKVCGTDKRSADVWRTIARVSPPKCHSVFLKDSQWWELRSWLAAGHPEAMTNSCSHALIVSAWRKGDCQPLTGLHAAGRDCFWRAHAGFQRRKSVGAADPLGLVCLLPDFLPGYVMLPYFVLSEAHSWILFKGFFKEKFGED